jgi:hypothetical protein
MHRGGPPQGHAHLICVFSVRIIVIGQHIPTPNTEYPTQHAKNKKGVTPSGVSPFLFHF